MRRRFEKSEGGFESNEKDLEVDMELNRDPEELLEKPE